MIAAIGDIHAYEDKLNNIRKNINDFENSYESVVFLGDYVDGGYQAKRVIEVLMDLQQKHPHWVFLKGNHEDMMLDAIRHGSKKYGHPDMWLKQGGNETLLSYGGLSGIPNEHLDWMESLPLTHETKSFIFVHAGLRPQRNVKNTSMHDKLWIRDTFINSNFDWGKRVIFGHTYNVTPVVMKNKIGIDCVHHGGGKLHAVLLDDSLPSWYDFITE